MSNDPRDCPAKPEPFHPSASHVEPGYRDGWNAALRACAAEIARLTAELYDEKAVNETQRYELKDRLQKQLAAEAELKEARKDAGPSDNEIDNATRHIYHEGLPTSTAYRVGIVRAALAAALRERS